MKKYEWLKQIGFSLMAIAFGVFLVMQLILSIGSNATVEHATYVTVRDATEMQSYLFRDETVISPEYRGAVCYYADDGAKVRAGDMVATMYSDESFAMVQQQIHDIDSRIEVLQRSAISEGATTSDINIINSNIQRYQLLYLKAAQSGDIEKALRYKNDLEIQTNRSKAISQRVDGYEAQIAELEIERSRLQATLPNDGYTVTSPASGYYYGSVDGYENLFTADALAKLSLKSLDVLSASVPNERLISSAAGKVVRSEIWYLVCVTDKRTAAAYTQGRSYTVIFPYSTVDELKMTYDRRITQTDDDTCLMVFKCNVLPDGFDFTRKQTVEVVSDEYSGLRVSTQALRMKDGRTGVFALDGNLVVFKETTVLSRESGYYVCKIPVNPDYPGRYDIAYRSSTQLSLYDTVITSGTGIYEGALLQ